jgi:hypothetical protein
MLDIDLLYIDVRLGYQRRDDDGDDHYFVAVQNGYGNWSTRGFGETPEEALASFCHDEDVVIAMRGLKTSPALSRLVDALAE